MNFKSLSDETLFIGVWLEKVFFNELIFSR